METVERSPEGKRTASAVGDREAGLGGSVLGSP